MSAWWDGRAVLFDLESDSPQPTEARIITACVAEVGPPGMPPGVRTWMAQTERPIPAEAEAIHGVSTEQANAEGEPREIVMSEIAARLCLARDDIPVIGHNVRYDLTLIDRELRRVGSGSLGTDGDLVTVRIDGRQVGAFHVIDTYVLDKAVDPYRPGKRQLPIVAEHYGVPLRGDAHTAEADALAAGRVAWAIAKRAGLTFAELVEMYFIDRRGAHVIANAFGDLGAMTLPELHHAQIEWARQQATGLAEYFTNRGDKVAAAAVSQYWPLAPTDETEASAAVG